MPDLTKSSANTGHLDGFTQLFSDHQHWLLAWLIRKLGTRHHAEDIAQDTFMRVLNSPLPGFIQFPKALLATTATNLIIDEARRRKLEQAYLESLLLISEQDHAFSPEQYQEALDLLHQLANVLLSLSDKARQAFLMNMLEDMSYAEIALKLGVSVSMVKQYLAKAMVLCYQALHPVQPS